MNSGVGISDPAVQRMLLDYARASAWHALNSVEPEPTAPPIVPGVFGGLFVTLWNKTELRGCMGTFEPTDDLVRTVGELSRSVLSDSRFVASRVTGNELADVTIELSVLSMPKRMGDSSALILGMHGVLIRRADRSGCFLPKVAIEKGWSVEEFLASCCTMKAGLSADAWRHPETAVYLFAAESFSDAASVS